MQIRIELATEEQAKAVANELDSTFFPKVIPHKAEVEPDGYGSTSWQVKLHGVRHVVTVNASFCIFAGQIGDNEHCFLDAPKFGVICHSVAI